MQSSSPTASLKAPRKHTNHKQSARIAESHPSLGSCEEIYGICRITQERTQCLKTVYEAFRQMKTVCVHNPVPTSPTFIRSHTTGLASPATID